MCYNYMAHTYLHCEHVLFRSAELKDSNTSQINVKQQISMEEVIQNATPHLVQKIYVPVNFIVNHNFLSMRKLTFLAATDIVKQADLSTYGIRTTKKYDFTTMKNLVINNYTYILNLFLLSLQNVSD